MTIKEQNQLNVFNSTSIAARMIVDHIKSINRRRFHLREWKAGRITLDELNRLRQEMGLPILTANYVKRLRMGQNIPTRTKGNMFGNTVVPWGSVEEEWQHPFTKVKESCELHTKLTGEELSFGLSQGANSVSDIYDAVARRW
jgi:hypothetical protein